MIAMHRLNLLLIDLLLLFRLLLWPRRGCAEVTGIIRLDAIGDFVIWMPAGRALVSDSKARKQRVVLIANALWASWAAELLDIDHVMPVDKKRFDCELGYRLQVLRQVHLMNLGRVIVPTYSRIPGDGNDSLVYASSASVRIGNRGYRSRHRMAGWLRWLLNLGYTQVLSPDDLDSQGTLRSEPEINAGFSRALGLPQEELIGRLADDPMAVLASMSLTPNTYVVMIPGGSWSGKAWPVERFAAIGRVVRDLGWTVIVSGSQDERALCEELATACGGVNLAGCTSLSTLAKVIQGARLVIGNDSAGMHIAVAGRTDSVCVMWGGSFGRFIPYAEAVLPGNLQARAVFHRMPCFGCTGCCPLPSVQGKVPCIAAVPVAAVRDTVIEILNGRPAASVNNAASSDATINRDPISNI
jgi:ADP-heptose:LPS heptosyltransferase